MSLDSSGTATLPDISTLQGGDHVIRADYAGDGNYLPSSGTVSLTVSPANTTTDLDVQPSTTVYGQSTTLAATVLSAVTTSGKVAFVDTTTGSTLATVNLDATGQASLDVNGLDVGTHDIRADFLANNNFKASSSSVVTLTINPAQTTTVVLSTENPSIVGDEVTFTATVTPEAASTLRPVAGSVTFVDTTTGTTLGSGDIDANGQFSISTSNLAVGTHTIKATYTDDSRYVTSSGTVDQEVDPIATTTTLSTSESPTAFGDSVTFTAFVSAAPNAAIPTGSVVFNVDGTNVATQSVDGTGQASFTTTLLPAGTHTIFAQYPATRSTSATARPIT